MERRKKKAKADFWLTPTFMWWVEEALHIGGYIGAFSKARADEECRAAGGEVCQVQVPERASGLSADKRPLSQAITSLSYLTNMHNHRALEWEPIYQMVKEGKSKKLRQRLFCHNFNL